MSSAEAEPAVVIHAGSTIVRAGFADDYVAPRVVFPTAREASGGGGGDDAAEDSRQKRQHQHRPITRIVMDWDRMEQIWRQAFFELDVSPAGQPVLLVEPPLNPRAHRVRMASIIFLRLEAPRLCVLADAVLSLMACDRRTTGAVLHCGSMASHSVAVVEGHVLPHSLRRLELGGTHLTDYLYHVLLPERGYTWSSGSGEREGVRGLKEKLGYVALDFDAELELMLCDSPSASAPEPEHVVQQELEYDLYGDGNTITVGKTELFRCTEALFQPAPLAKALCIEIPTSSGGGVHRMLDDTIKSCGDEGIQRGMFGSVVMTGATCCFAGMAQRLTKELAQLAPVGTDVVIANNDSANHAAAGTGSNSAALSADEKVKRKYCAWIGGAHYAESTPSAFLSKDQFFSSI